MRFAKAQLLVALVGCPLSYVFPEYLIHVVVFLSWWAVGTGAWANLQNARLERRIEK